MPSTLSNSDGTDAVANTKLQPLYSDKEPIIWSGNPAHIDGILYEINKFYTRTGQFQPLFNSRAVLLNNGKSAVESLQAIPFINGVITTGIDHSFDLPCPPTPARFFFSLNYARTVTSAAEPNVTPTEFRDERFTERERQRHCVRHASFHASA